MRGLDTHLGQGRGVDEERKAFQLPPRIGQSACARAHTLCSPASDWLAKENFLSLTSDWRLFPRLFQDRDWPLSSRVAPDWPSDARTLRVSSSDVAVGGVPGPWAGSRLRLRSPSCCILTGPRFRTIAALGTPPGSQVTQFPARVRSVQPWFRSSPAGGRRDPGRCLSSLRARFPSTPRGSYPLRSRMRALFRRPGSEVEEADPPQALEWRLCVGL